MHSRDSEGMRGMGLIPIDGNSAEGLNRRSKWSRFQSVNYTSCKGRSSRELRKCHKERRRRESNSMAVKSISFSLRPTWREGVTITTNVLAPWGNASDASSEPICPTPVWMNCEPILSHQGRAAAREIVNTSDQCCMISYQSSHVWQYRLNTSMIYEGEPGSVNRDIIRGGIAPAYIWKLWGRKLTVNWWEWYNRAIWHFKCLDRNNYIFYVSVYRGAIIIVSAHSINNALSTTNVIIFLVPTFIDNTWRN